jgi:hypothetical protein
MELTVVHDEETFSYLFEVRKQPMWAMKKNEEKLSVSLNTLSFL